MENLNQKKTKKTKIQIIYKTFLNSILILNLGINL